MFPRAALVTVLEKRVSDVWDSSSLVKHVPKPCTLPGEVSYEDILTELLYLFLHEKGFNKREVPDRELTEVDGCRESGEVAVCPKGVRTGKRKRSIFSVCETHVMEKRLLWTGCSRCLWDKSSTPLTSVSSLFATETLISPVPPFLSTESFARKFLISLSENTVNHELFFVIFPGHTSHELLLKLFMTSYISKIKERDLIGSLLSLNKISINYC